MGGAWCRYPSIGLHSKGNRSCYTSAYNLSQSFNNVCLLLNIFTCAINCLATVSNIQQPQELCASLGTCKLTHLLIFELLNMSVS